MKKSLASLMLIAATATSSQAYDFSYMTFRTADGSEASVSTDNLTITFTGTNLVAESTDGSLTLPLTQLSSMMFAHTPTAIDKVEGDAAPEGPVTVFTVDGKCLGTYTDEADAATRLPKGTYILNTNGKVTKIVL